MTRPTWDETWMAVALTIGQRSTCVRDKVGAVVVTAGNRIVDTGYNGPPAGWQPIHSDACTVWCPRAAAAHWIAQSHGEDLPAIVTQDAFHGPLDDYSDCPSLHAEANALMFSDRRLREGGTIYVSSGTCSGCAKLVANSGLARAVYMSTNSERRDSERWYQFLRDCGLDVYIME